MLNFDDPKWKELSGGYRIPYDASVALRELEAGEDAWDELWQELHHQGDVGEASYAAVPHLVRIASAAPQIDKNLFSLVATIEIERHRGLNPPLPDWCQAAYAKAWAELIELALRDIRHATEPFDVQSLLGVIALARGQRNLGELLALTEPSELEDLFARFRE
ncbi:hypothetical protein A176_002846 [Myxococcus hansupus]|uniref:Uncharacterized protein n=1 Tax=Pseudomyxococcus hansupus TaxID=1297742 RepID=A0A0H4WSZ9_9BACT|nr:hypothetical protein [Myxococcus hansupus]AKQ65934.1 hypothetical protein A176_002846 [Myxococcus hansupus]